MSDLLFENKGTTDSVGSWSGDSNFEILESKFIQ